MPRRKSATTSPEPVDPTFDLEQRIRFRAYTSEDRSACQRIAGSSNDYAHAVDANADAMEVAVVEDRVIGFAFIQVWAWNRVAWLGEIVIDAEFRNRGIGTRLLRRMEARAQEKDCRTIMDHPPANHRAVRFYLERGYRICGYNDCFFDADNRTALFLCKELA